MKQKPRRTLQYTSGRAKPEASNVGDLAAHMSELQRLRKRVRDAEAAARSLAKGKPVFAKRAN
jgi:hypothetical protein